MAALPYVALVVALTLVYLPTLVVLRERRRLPEGVDNAHPRAQQAKLTGLGQRAVSAHANGFESFAAFAAAVLACEQRHVADDRIAAACLVYLVARAIYIGLYLGNLPTARSTVWGISLASVTALFVCAIRA